MSDAHLIVLPDFENGLELSIAEVRSLIDRIEAFAAQAPQIEIPLEHHFSKDVYAREIFIPKGSLIVGKIHKYQNLNIISSGEVSVLSFEGAKRVKAPYTFVSEPGAKRVIYAHEDATWTTVHGTAETDVDKIEEHFIAKTYDDLPQVTETKIEIIEGDLWHG